MITPTGVSVANFVSASLAGADSHIRITFIGGNIVLEDDDIEQSGVSIVDALNADTNLTMGRAVSKEVTIPIIYSSKLNGLIWTVEFKLEYGVDINGTTNWVTLGYFSGKKPNRYITSDLVDFVAYDRMQKFDIIADEWLESLTYPMTVLQMFKSLCAYCGVGWRAGDELPNIKARSFASAPIDAKGLTCRDILAMIAEACGCYAKIDNDGYCKMVWFSNQTSNYELTADDEYAPIAMFANSVSKSWEDLETYKWADLENYTWADIEGMETQFRVDGVQVKYTEDDNGVLYPDGIEGNIYMIIDNPFLAVVNSSDITDYIVPIYTRLNNIGGYVPVRLSTVGCAIIEAGDIINITANNEIVRMPVFVKTMVWNGALIDSLETTGDVVRETVSGDISKKLFEGGRYHKWKNTVEELYSELYDPTTGDVSVLQQTASALGMSAQGIDIQGGKYININSGADLNIEGGDVTISSGGEMYVRNGNLNIDSSGQLNVEGGSVNITSDGNLSISSGGKLDVDATNFKINSTNKTVKSGDWTLSDTGIEFAIDDTVGSHRFHLGDAAKSYSNGLSSCQIISERTSMSSQGQTNYVPSLYFYFNDPIRGTSRTLYIYTNANGNLEITSTGGKYSLYNVGTIDAGNGYYDDVYYYNLHQRSSRDIKHNILPMQPIGERLDGLNPVTFVYDNDTEEKTRHGLIYEDTIEVMPEICTGDESNKAINYVELIPMLLKEIQELRARVKALEEREEQ